MSCALWTRSIESWATSYHCWIITALGRRGRCPRSRSPLTSSWHTPPLPGIWISGSGRSPAPGRRGRRAAGREDRRHLPGGPTRSRTSATTGYTARRCRVRPRHIGAGRRARRRAGVNNPLQMRVTGACSCPYSSTSRIAACCPSTERPVPCASIGRKAKRTRTAAARSNENTAP